MIPQNNSCGNDSDMIVAVKSDYQIMSQDTQLLNLIVNESTANKTNASRGDTSLNKCSNLKEDCSSNQDREKILRNPNTAKYFEPQHKLPSENTTNNTVNIYPLLVKNYQNLVALDNTSTTLSSNTVNIFQLLNTNVSNNTSTSSNSLTYSSDLHLNNATSKYNSFNLSEANNHSFIQDNVINSKTDNISLPMVGSDDNFLNEALNILEKLKQDPSYYNKIKSNQIPSTEEIKENGDMSLANSKTKFLNSDNSALASDAGEGLVQEFENIKHENHDISNLEGNVNDNIPTSTCLPFFMSFNSEPTTTQLTDLSIPKEVSFEKVPLKGIGSNVSQELNIRDNATSSDTNVSFTSKCKPLIPNNGVGETPQITLSPVQSYISISVGYGVQSNDSSQTLSVKSCKPSNGLYTESTNVTTLTIPTSQANYGVGAADNLTSVSTSEPNYVLQTHAAAKIAVGSELNITDSPISFAVTSILFSGSDSYLSINQTECVTSISKNATIVAPELEDINIAPSAGEIKSSNISENIVLNISQTDVPVTHSNQQLLTRTAVPLNGSISQSLPSHNGIEIKSTESISNAMLQTVSPIIVVSSNSTINAAAGLNSLSGIQTECVTNSNINVKQEFGVPQAGVGTIPQKITLEPQISCGTMKKEESSSTLCPVDGQEACFNDKDLTLPLVKSSIFLANNNELPKGKDIPISLNASIDEFSLSDLQEKEDGKVAELYNHNPLLFNVEREPTGAFLKPRLKYYKSVVSKSPNFYFDKIYNPDSNQLIKMNFAENNVILEKRPSYKSETNNRICNNTLENNKKLTNYEIEPADSDSLNLKPEPTVPNSPQKITSTKSDVYNGIEQKYVGTTIKLLDSRQPANEEENLLTILNTFDKTTLGIKANGEYQKNGTLPEIPNISPNDNIVYTPMPVNVDKDLNPQDLGKNNTQNGDTLKQQDNENMNSQLNSLINLATKQPNLSQKPRQKPKGSLPGRISSKPYKCRTDEVKTGPNFSSSSSGDETIKEKTTQNKNKMCIPADSVQKIVIEIVRNTKKPENKPDSYGEKTKYDNEENVISIAGKKEKTSHNEIKDIKQNYVPFKSAWMPVQTKETQSDVPQSDTRQQNLDYRNNKIRDILKPEIYESDSVQDTNLQTQNDKEFSKNQNAYKQEQIPKVIKEFNANDQTATIHDKSLGANILRLLKADKSSVKNK